MSNYSSKIQIFVRVEGKLITLFVDESEYISTVKNNIYMKENIALLNQRLIFAGRQLLDDKLIMDYKISNESIIDLSMRVKGGWRSSHRRSSRSHSPTSHSSTSHSSTSHSPTSHSPTSHSPTSRSSRSHNSQSGIGGFAARAAQAAFLGGLYGLFGDEMEDWVEEQFCSWIILQVSDIFGPTEDISCSAVVTSVILFVLMLPVIAYIVYTYLLKRKTAIKTDALGPTSGSESGGSGESGESGESGDDITYILILVFVVSCLVYYFWDEILDTWDIFEDGEEDYDAFDIYEMSSFAKSGHFNAQVVATNTMKYNSDAAHGKCCEVVEDTYEICGTAQMCESNICVANPYTEPIPINGLDAELSELDNATDFIHPGAKSVMLQMAGMAVDDAIEDGALKLLKGVGNHLVMSRSPLSASHHQGLANLNGGKTIHRPHGKIGSSGPQLRGRGTSIRRLRGLAGLISPFDIMVGLLDLWDPASFGDYVSNTAAKELRDEADKSFISDLKLLGINAPYVFQLDHLNSTHLHDDWKREDWTEFDFLYDSYKEAYNIYLLYNFEQAYNLAKDAEGVTGTPTNEQLDKIICRLTDDSDGSTDSLHGHLNDEPEKRDTHIYDLTNITIFNNYVDLTLMEPHPEPTGEVRRWQTETVDSLKLLLKREMYILNQLILDDSLSTPPPEINPVAISQTTPPIIINDKTRSDAYKLIKTGVETDDLTQPLKDYLLSNFLPISSDIAAATTFSELPDPPELVELFSSLSRCIDASVIKIPDEEIDYFTEIFDNTGIYRIESRLIESSSSAVQVTGVNLHLLLLKEMLAIFQSKQQVNLTRSYVQYFNALSTEHRTGVSLSEFGVEQYAAQINNTITSHENGQVYPTGPRTFPENYVISNDNLIDIPVPIYSEYYRDLNSTAVLDIDPEREIKAFMAKGAIGYTMDTVGSELDSQYKIPGEIFMYKIPDMTGVIKTTKNGQPYSPSYIGKIPQIYLNKLTMDKICRKGLPGLLEIKGEDSNRPGFMDGPEFVRETGPHIDNIILDEINNTGLCANIEDDFCDSRLGSFQPLGAGDITTPVYKGSNCSPTQTAPDNACKFDTSQTDCEADSMCTWTAKSYPTTSIAPLIVDNCDTTYRNAIAEWGGTGVTIAGTVGRVLADLGVTTGATPSEVASNVDDDWRNVASVFGG